MKRKKPSRLTKAGWVLPFTLVGAGLVLCLHLISWATGPVFLFPGSQVLFEWHGRPWCTSHSRPLPMYESLTKEVANAELDGVRVGIMSPWKCWVCGTNWSSRATLSMWIHGRKFHGSSITIRKAG